MEVTLSQVGSEAGGDGSVLGVKVNWFKHSGYTPARKVRWKEKVLRLKDDGHSNLSHTFLLVKTQSPLTQGHGMPALEL